MNISLLGSTGSIGTQTLEIVRENKDLCVKALAANKNTELLEKQIREFKPELACVYDEEAAKKLKTAVADTSTRIVSGMDGLIEAARVESAKTVVNAVVGMIGIRPTVEAIKSGHSVALANKETLVTAGHIIMQLVKDYGVSLMPIDSEHSAIFQALESRGAASCNMDVVDRIILTASGGPFRGRKRSELENVTLNDALKHPTWTMGRKITIDSATLVNKGLEVIEACRLFDLPCEKIQVVVQPQSIIHSAVEFIDGSIIAQMGLPDMKLPIQYALFYPERRHMSSKRLDFFELSRITFEKPDMETFKGLGLAFKAYKRGGNATTVYNAANEFAVGEFLESRVSFNGISDMIEKAVENVSFIENPTLEEVLYTEKETYSYLKDIQNKKHHGGKV